MMVGTQHGSVSVKYWPPPETKREPELEKTYLLTFEGNEDSDQPAHPSSLFRVFVVRKTKLCILAQSGLSLPAFRIPGK